ncbi:GntR family transcriptional regulator [Streptomyces sp. NPDC020917]|uniref:GntR family transcriptional regulator n=1 Tax=Streptomyces sp. NPDC020917 TaxID=3365102 RepID=UPI0037B1B6E9
MPKLKYEQIADSLRNRIAEGEFGSGALLPSGRDLCEQWGVSRATVIKAMEVLRGDGLVAARHGQGFRVVETPLARPAGRRLAGSPRTRGGRPFRRLGAPAREVPPEGVSAALGQAAGAPALRRDRMVLSAEGSPFSLVSAWFPADVADRAPRLAQRGPIAEGTTHYVARETGRSPARGRDVTTVRTATAREARSLERSDPLTVVVVLHTAYDAADAPLVVEEGVTPADLWELVDDYPMGEGN